MERFSDSVIEKIQYYVYFLSDDNGKIFYIGKGKGNRIFEHVKCALNNETVSDKYDKIRQIINSGKKVQYFIVRHGLEEYLALEIESTLIDFCFNVVDSELTNIAYGHNFWDRGVKSVEEIVQYYDIEKAEIEDSVIIININKLYKRIMSSEEMYNATRASWRLSLKRCQKVKYVICDYHGIAREVFEITEWKKIEDGSRVEFIGHIADEKLRNKYYNKSLSDYRVRNRNPIRYVNC